MDHVARINSLGRAVPTWAVYILLLLPVPLYFYMATTGGMGVEPINALERKMGEIALQLVIAGLCITPLRRFASINLIRFRRTLGVLAFTYLCVHLVIWVLLDMSLRWDQMWADILKRPYITIGMAAFVMAVPLALTSNNLSIRKLGPLAWRRLHKLTYAIAVLGAVHFVMVQKVWETEPLIYLVVIAVLLLLRLQLGQQGRARA